MNILVTGGAGCIGSDLCEALLAQGDSVTALDNLSSGKRDHIEGMLQNPKFRFIQGDLLDLALVERSMEGIDFVYHMAANPDVKFTPGDPTDKDLNQNTICTYHVLEAMRRKGVRKLAFASTSAVYGISPEMPIREDSFFPRPISLYGATKQGCEALICSFQNLFEMQCWIFRFANIVGPKVRSKGRTVIGDFIFRLQQDPSKLLILGNGQQAKSYLLSEECVSAMLFAVEHATEPVNIFNLGCADWLSVNEIANMVTEAMGLKGVRYEYTGGEGGWPGDVPRFRLDVTRINQLGWHAKRNSAQAVEIAIQTTHATMTGKA
jgi:UDP-glucose 4-epimerase